MENNKVYSLGKYWRKVRYDSGIEHISADAFKKLYKIFATCNHDTYNEFRNSLRVNDILLKDDPINRVLYSVMITDYTNGIRVDLEKKTNINTKYTIKQALICENCFNVIPTNVNIDIHEPIDWYKQSDLYLGVGMLCPKCNKKFFHFAVDRNIANLVSLFNRLGYYTDYSCQGHPDVRYDTSEPEDGRTRLHPTYAFHYAHPYIAINGKKRLSKKMYKLLRSLIWNVEVDNPDTEDGMPWIVNEDNKCIGAKKFTIRLSGAYIDSFLCQLTNDIKSEKHIKVINVALDDFFNKRIKELYNEIDTKILIPLNNDRAKRGCLPL